MRNRFFAEFVLLAITAIWGFTFVMVQNAIQVLAPYSFLAVRFGLAFLILLPFLFRRTTQESLAQTKKRGFLLAGGLLGIWLFAGYAFQTLGLLYTTSSKAGFITGLSVVLVPVFSAIILRIFPKVPAILGVILAAIGLYYLTLGESLTINKGDVLVFFGAIGFALQIVFTGKYAKVYDALPLTIIQLGVVSLLSFGFAFVYEDLGQLSSPEVIFNPDVLIALFVTSAFATSFAYLAQTRFQRYTTPTRVALIFSMEPVFAAIFGVVVANELLGISAILGSILIFIGMIFAELPTETFTKRFRSKRIDKKQNMLRGCANDAINKKP